LITLIPLACITCSSLGLTFGTIFDPRTVPLLFGIIILPLTFLGGTYYSWTTLAPVTVGGFHWLQVLVLVNPLIYINEGMRGALTTAPHMSLWVVYPVLLGFSALFLWTGTRNFRRRVIS
jgi:ABC-2 type transport system permease protein